MSKVGFETIVGTIIGTLLEEGLEEFFPGIGELGVTGEITGALSGLVHASWTQEETKAAFTNFVKYVYKALNQQTVEGEITKEELDTFANQFAKIPTSKQREIIQHYKSLSPYEYSLIQEFLNGLEKA